MKLSHSFILIFLMSFFAFSSSADEYKAPKFRWKQPKSLPNVKVVQEKDFKEFGENSYRVDEDPESQRNVASEEEEEGRGPSSTKQDPYSPAALPASWHYEGPKVEPTKPN